MRKTMNVVSALMRAAFTRTCFVLIAAFVFSASLAKADDYNWRAAKQRTQAGVQQAPRAAAPQSAPFISPQQRGRLINALRIAAPANMHPTTDLQECGTHGGLLGGPILCQSLLPKGELALVWDWNGQGDIDGYRIYRTDNGNRVAVGTQAPGKQVTLFVVPPPSDGYNGKCYAVTAYQGGKESDLSNNACAGGGNVVQTVTLTPQHLRGVQKSVIHFTGFSGAVGGGDPGANISNPGFVVGYFYDTEKAPAGDTAWNYISRTGLYFDVGGVAGKSIRAARLNLTVGTTALRGHRWGAGPQLDHTTSCVGRIGLGVSYWWNYSDWIDAAIVVQPGVATGPDVSYDVTQLVRDWANGSPNYGMVLLGDEENLDAFTERGCETTYLNNSTLYIEFTQ
jgi:hypothetical protein